MKKIALFVLIGGFTVLQAQTNTTMNLPYHEIPEAPINYDAASVTARMLDGLGFRYYWATEGLTQKDLAYKPSEEARTSKETMRHIYDLTTVIHNALIEAPNTGAKVPEMDYETLRVKTLNNIKACSDILRTTDTVANYKIVFKKGESSTEFPFWNLINGPIADAIWHAGQLVSLRRASGNPFNSKASVLTGKVKQ